MSAVQESELREKFHQYRPKELLSSEDCYGTGQFWTVGDVKAVLEKCYGVSYRYRGSYRNLLHRCGFSYQKGEQVYKSRPSELAITNLEAGLEKSD